MALIAERQNREPNLRRQAAARSRYTRAKVPDTIAGIGSVLLAIASPIAVFYAPMLGEPLAAVAGAWLFVGRLILRPYRARLTGLGAAIQDRFDRNVFGLDEPTAAVSHFSEEEIRHWSRGARLDDFRDWYPTTANASWPESVLVCQRANVVWSRRQHARYAECLAGGAALCFVVGVLVAFADDLSFRSYMLALLMPSLPALLDASELARAHHGAAAERAAIERTLDEYLRSPGKVTPEDLETFQKMMTVLRTNAPLVPDWFYRWIARPHYETEMQHAADVHAFEREQK